MSLVIDPTLIGTVQDVNGASVRVELRPETVTGLSFVNGESYRIGQVGSFIRIPLGFVNLYGVVSQVGAGAAPVPKAGETPDPYGNRWLLAQLVGEGRRGGQFERGLSQHPTIDDSVHIVTETDLRTIYGHGDLDDYVTVGRLASAESIPALVDINKLVTRHSAVVGTTGAGKSTTVAGLLTSLSDPSRYPSSRIVVFDIHGEYAKALQDRCNVYRVGSTDKPNEYPLSTPYWALTFDEFSKVCLGVTESKDAAAFQERITALKVEAFKKYPRGGLTVERITVDTPVPFSIHRLWYEMHCEVIGTFREEPGKPQCSETWAVEKDSDGNQILGDAMSAIPPSFLPIKDEKNDPEKIRLSRSTAPRKPIDTLASKLRDPRLDFLFKPGDWLPELDGKITKDIDALLESWIGDAKPTTILDLSGIPSTILTDLIGALIRILYDAVFWARNLPEGGRERPLLLVLEEAHAYLNTGQANFASDVVKRIAKEGRKYGVGLMVVSQRPAEIDTTILSQCGTIFAMRLSNDIDRGHVTSSASDNLKGLFDMLPILRTGEAIIVGEAVSLPIRTLIDPPPKDRRPDSADPRVAVRGSLNPDADGYDGPGGWNQRRDRPQDYPAVARQWRQQEHNKKNKSMNMIPVSSSNLAAIGYDEISFTLRVEFKNGSSKKSVGELGFRKIPKCVKQRDLQQVEAAIAVCFSHAQIYPQVEPLDNAA